MTTNQMLSLLGQATVETLYMVFASTVISYLFALILGTILFVTDENGILECRPVNRVLGFIVNVGRSIPFIILIIALQPFTRALVGTTIGATATIVALIVSATPFIARMVESSLREVDAGVIEAAESMGSTPFQIIWKVLLAEARPSILVGATISTTTIIGYTAMASFVGAGGLGAVAVNYGYYRYETVIMIIVLVLIVILVELIQSVGMYVAKKTDKRIH